ncbi:MAG: pseudaminic acid biosynthesis-associated methylase [Selenomonadaceae bacterium]|nr:pseudaminic acid biosynthesis-associated methylase [Selenomonadaceae bacterium]
MVHDFKTEQEAFWAGEFGDKYISRNSEKELFAAKISLWSKILQKGETIENCLEFGPNIGMNLKALGILFPHMDMYGVEINKNAAEECGKLERTTVYNESILEFSSEKKFDLVFTCGVLIHINPDELVSVYDKMYQFSRKYIVICEYYNPSPVEIPYRGNKGKLFKRDFSGELMDRFRNLKLVDYGFLYHRDNHFPMDDLTWFLLEKSDER